MKDCQVNGCTREGKHYRIYLDSPNSTALNGWLCDEHYSRLLDVILATNAYGLREVPLNCEKNTKGET